MTRKGLASTIGALALALLLLPLLAGGCAGDDTARFSLAVDASGLLKEVASLELVVYDETASCDLASGAVTKGDDKRLFETSQESLDTVAVKAITIGTRVFSVVAYRGRFTDIVGQGCQSVTLAESSQPVAVSIQLQRVGDPPKGILFISDRAGAGQSALYVAEFDGANPTRVSTAPLSGDEYAVAPDGLVTFIGLAGSRARLHTVRLDGQGEGVIGAGLDVNPAFSADGKTIYYASNSGGDFDIYSVASTGGTPTDLSNDPSGVDAFPAVGPSGEVVYIRDFDDGNTRVTDLYKLASGTPTKVFDGPLRPIAPRFAGPSTVVVVKGAPSGANANGQVVAIDLGTGAETDLSGSSTTRDRDPAVSPDGSKVVFVSDRDGSDALFMVNIDGSGLSKLTAGGQPSFHPDGDRVVYVKDGDVYEIALAGGTPKLLVQNSAQESRPRYVP
ncbi:MAG: PD40 domain-containing protein [Myxococcales bacterium]|nr:PD40 domain-containing protein [Myxococcales bacterium]